MKQKFIIILLLFCIKSFGQDTESHDIRYVISEDGLNVRTAPDINAEIILTLKKGSEVQIHEISKSKTITLPNGYNGNWIKINYEQMHGYVFDAYMSELKPINFTLIDNKDC